MGVMITPERYQAFLDAFLHLGPHYHAVAKRVGCSPETARKAWEKGWPKQPYGAPISKIYAESLRRLGLQRSAAEASATTALAQQAKESELPAQRDRVCDAVQQDSPSPPQSPAQLLQDSAINAMQGEIDLLTCFRGNLIGAVSISKHILTALEALGEAVAENTIIASKNVAQATPERLLKPLERFARIMGLLSSSAEQVMKMQRLLVGAPQQITEQRGESTADQVERVQRMHKLVDIMQRNGLLTAVAQPVEPERYEGEEADAKGQSDAA